MTTIVRAQFDGKAFIPDKPVMFTPGEAVELEIHSEPLAGEDAEARVKRLEIQLRLEKARLVAGRISGPTLPAEALERESLYEGRP